MTTHALFNAPLIPMFSQNWRTAVPAAWFSGKIILLNLKHSYGGTNNKHMIHIEEILRTATPCDNKGSVSWSVYFTWVIWLRKNLSIVPQDLKIIFWGLSLKGGRAVEWIKSQTCKCQSTKIKTLNPYQFRGSDKWLTLSRDLPMVRNRQNPKQLNNLGALSWLSH